MKRVLRPDDDVRAWNKPIMCDIRRRSCVRRHRGFKYPPGRFHLHNTHFLFTTIFSWSVNVCVCQCLCKLLTLLLPFKVFYLFFRLRTTYETHINVLSTPSSSLHSFASYSYIVHITYIPNLHRDIFLFTPQK